MDRLIGMLRNTLYVLIMGLVVLGCSAETHPERQRIVVYAASSLTDVLRELESRFENSYPEIDVAVAFSGSPMLTVSDDGPVFADGTVQTSSSELIMVAFTPGSNPPNTQDDNVSKLWPSTVTLVPPTICEVEGATDTTSGVPM